MQQIAAKPDTCGSVMPASSSGRPTMSPPRRPNCLQRTEPVSAGSAARRVGGEAPPTAAVDIWALLAARRPVRSSPLALLSPTSAPSVVASSSRARSVPDASILPAVKRPRHAISVARAPSPSQNAFGPWTEPPAKRRAVSDLAPRDRGSFDSAAKRSTVAHSTPVSALRPRSASPSAPSFPTVSLRRPDAPLEDRDGRGPYALETLSKVAPLHGLLAPPPIERPPRAASLPAPDRNCRSSCCRRPHPVLLSSSVLITTMSLRAGDLSISVSRALAVRLGVFRLARRPSPSFRLSVRARLGRNLSG